jgi:ureidoglycolate hydrolase
MRQINVNKLTVEAFHKYGDFIDLNKEFSEGEKNNDNSLIMHWEVITQNLGITTNPAFFLCFFKDIPLMVTKLEAHNTCEEVLIFADDVIAPVAPATAGKPDPDTVEAFFVPRYTMIKYNCGIWHYAPIPYGTNIGRAFYSMPQKVNNYDESPVALDPKDYIEIIPMK